MGKILFPLVILTFQIFSIWSVIHNLFSSAEIFTVIGVVCVGFVIFGVFLKRFLFIGFAVLLLVICVFSAVRAERVVFGKHASVLDGFVDSYAIVSGIVAGDPDVRSNKQFIVIEPFEIRSNTQTFPINHPTLIRASIGTEFTISHGDTVRVRGTLRKPQPFESDTGKLFYYDRYLAVRDVFYTLSNGRIQEIIQGDNSFSKGLYSIKHALIFQSNRYIHEPYAGLVAGVLYGIKGALTTDLSTLFREAGIIHIVVLSGSNIIIVAQFLFALCTFIPLRKRLLIVLGGIWIFTLMTGAEPPIIRAAIMGSLALIATHTGRTAGGLRALLLTIIFLTLHNPVLLLWDIGFQLSCAATAGLMLFTKPLTRFFLWIPSRFALRETFVTTLATQIAVTPLLLIFIGELSLIAPLTNVLILPAVPLAMLGGFITQLTGFVLPSFAHIFGFVTTIPAWFLVFVARLGELFSFTTLTF